MPEVAPVKIVHSVNGKGRKGNWIKYGKEALRHWGFY